MEFPPGPNVVVPTAPAGNSSNRPASTEFVTAAVAAAAVATATQTFLQSDVLLNNVANYFDVINTGSVGASGQVWEINAAGAFLDTAGVAGFFFRIWDGTTTYAEGQAVAAGASFSYFASITAIVTLSAAATFTFSCKDTSSANGKVLCAGSTPGNKMTYIIAKRLS